jgi:hypothetical protein
VRTLLALSGSAVVLWGCSALQPDYVAPVGVPSATVEVTNSEGTLNRRVLVHGQDVCAGSQARLVGLLRSKTISVDYKESLTFAVEAGRPVAISSPWSNPEITGISAARSTATIEGRTTYCQAVVSFVPVQGHRYQLDFGPCCATLVDTSPGEPARTGRAPLYHECALGPANNDPRMFFLVPKQ